MKYFGLKQLVIIATFSAVALLVGCRSDPAPSSATAPTIAPVSALPPAPVKSDPFGLKPGSRLVYTVAKEEDKNANGLDHPCVSIWLPLGLSRSTVDQNLRWATKAEYDKYVAMGVKPDAVRTWAYKRGSDLENGENGGMCEFSPHGNYIESGSGVPLDQYRMAVELNDQYFQPVARPAKAVASISEGKRHRIAFLLAKADAQADNDAENQIPTNNLFSSGNTSREFALKQMKANHDLEETLDTRYIAAVCRQFRISPDQADAIQSEALLKSWPVYHDERH